MKRDMLFSEGKCLVYSLLVFYIQCLAYDNNNKDTGKEATKFELAWKEEMVNRCIVRNGQNVGIFKHYKVTIIMLKDLVERVDNYINRWEILAEAWKL